MTVCVIGGAGFIGKRVVRQFAKEGHEVVCLDINTAVSFDDLGKQVKVARLDLTHFEDVMIVLATYRPEIVVNLSYMRENLPRTAMRLNVLGMDNCFEAARLCEVERIVYSSSIAVNGSQRPYGRRKVHETDPPFPAKQYAVHKVFNEWQAKEYREKHGMIITGIRAANVAGTDKLIGSVDHVDCIVRPAMGQRSVLDFRDRMRCVVHADDIARVFTTVASAKKPRHAIYNSGGEPLSLGQISDMVRKVLPKADIVFGEDTGGEDRSGAYMFDNERLVSEFGIQYPPYAQRIAEMVSSVRRGEVLG